MVPAPRLRPLFTIVLLGLLFTAPGATAEETDLFAGFELRGIGPALMSGRISHIELHPDDPNTWYVAVGSGGVWKTVNAGTTWTPLFDEQVSYSIGTIELDPQNPNVVWVGTGEDVGGRHVGYGDGLYRSADGGLNWEHRGLEDSEHIARILVHPEDSNVIYVAAQGPLWSPGGQRGFFRSTDGGETWTKTLGDEEFTGVTDLVMDPRDPDVLYAATWQHHRTVAAYMGGGPKTRIHRSDDGGLTWRELGNNAQGGLPQGNIGKIGLAISPQDPDTIYAAMELDRRKGAVYRSTDRGESWEKRSDTVSGGTGPHYYQELYASPHHEGWIYLVSNTSQISFDGGATFEPMSNENKHVDDHAIAFRADDPDYLMFGCDGGIYETFDHTDTWRYVANLPVTQFYKVDVDDDEPFYNVYGGTQDNNSQGGPSRTDNLTGIRNSDWFITLFGDGHDQATEPGNPDIVYSMWQQGNVVRYDRKTGEIVYIKPQAGPGENRERFNWDAPILISPHSPTRLYFASQRVWRSDNRGDSWRAISGDLTRNEDRLTLPIMGATQSWDNAWDVLAMSNYNTITSLAESPKQEGLIWAGTDDGRLQVTTDGGENWRLIEVGELPGVPATAFVNDIKASLYDAETVFVALDNHKYGDYTPYLLKSTDTGKSWTSIRGNLPDRTLVWRVVQDHEREALMFAATEYGIYFTVNGGGQWTRLEGGVPTISFRDLAIQRRENDLVGASFGRGFYILDDIAPFREISAEQLDQPATLFSTRKAWWYVPRSVLGFFPGKGDQGASHFLAPNPPFGAVFTYYLKEDLQTAKQTRQQAEKQAAEDDNAIEFPGWDAVEAERREPKPKVWLTVRDSDGNIIRRVEGPTKKGFHRVAWDLRYPRPNAMMQVEPPPPMWGLPPRGLMAAPGTYTVTLTQQLNGEVTELSEARSFDVVQLRKGALEGADPQDVAAFWRELESGHRLFTALQVDLQGQLDKTKRMADVLAWSQADPNLEKRYHAMRARLLALDEQLNGHRARQEPGEKVNPTIGERLMSVQLGVENSTYGPTPTIRKSLEIAQKEIRELHGKVQRSSEAVDAFGRALVDAGAPWLEGGDLPKVD